MAESRGPLDGTLVVEFGNLVAAPYAAMLLADMGARVVKVEPIDGDLGRGFGPYQNGESTFFMMVNRGKESLCVDTKDWLSKRVLDNLVKKAHVLVLVSESEGWPKALMEGMAYGLVCIGSSRGFIPQLLGDGRGLVVPAGNVEALAQHLARIAADPDAYAAMSRAAAGWAQTFSLERLRQELRSLLERSWARPLSEAHQLKA